MTKYYLPYGTSYQTIDIADNYQPDVIIAPDIECTDSQSETIRGAILSPVKPINDLDLNRHSQVGIAINDKTRPVPHQLILPPLLEWVHQAGIPEQNITFFIASGTHLPIQEDEYNRILPEEIIKKYKIVSHDCDDTDNLKYLGNTKQGTPIYINQHYYQSDLKIVVGNIEPHHFMGYSGGAKSASIGLTGRATINHNHALLINPLSRVGEYDNNPMRQDVEEIGTQIGVHLAFNVILNGKKEIIHAMFGKPSDVMQAGVPLSKKACQVHTAKQYDLVIASAGGFPKDINLYQAQKAITHAALVTKDHGIVILVAECSEGSGSRGFEQFIADVHNPEEAIQKFSRQGFTIGPHKAFQIAQQASRIRIYLVSKIDSESVRNYFLFPAENLSGAFDDALKHLPPLPQIAIMPKATNTIPYT